MAAILAAFAGVFLAGCGHSPDLPPMADVHGQVTLDGKPLPRGFVQFVPDPVHGTTGPTAVGKIDADGHYALITAGVPGAIVGFHKVSVESTEEQKRLDAPPPPSLIPKHYNNPDTSQLIREVKADQDNVINLELTSRGPQPNRGDAAAPVPSAEGLGGAR
jgi:hypothetical protein